MVPPSSPPRTRSFQALELAGRESERRLLLDSLAASALGHGQLVIVGGEAGIGKTALTRDLSTQAEADGFAVLTGHCFDISATPPYGPWIDASCRYLPGPDMPKLPGVLSTDRIIAIESKAALFSAVRQFLARLTAVRPTLLVLEDLHWADPASLDLLRHVCSRLAGLPLLVVATYRVDELTRNHPLYRQLPPLLRESEGTRLDLHPLDPDAVRALVASRWRLAAVDEDRLVDYLGRHAEGNPFFALELLHALSEEGRLSIDAGQREATLTPLEGVVMPARLRQVIDVRAGRLGDAATAALSLAAVIGQEVPLDLWRSVSGLEEDALLEIVERAVDAHFLDATRDGTRVRFVHALSREALYEGVLPPRRRILHRQVAEALIAMSAPDPDAVAYHLRQAGDPRAWEWLIRAGDRAQRAYAWLTAVERSAAAADLLIGVPGMERLRLQLLCRCGRLRRFSAPEQGIADLVEAERLAHALGDAVMMAETRNSLGVLYAYADDFHRSLDALYSGIEALEAIPSPEVDASWRAHSWMADALPAVDVGDGPGEDPGRERLAAAGIHHRRGTLPWFLAAAGRYRETTAEANRFLTAVGAGPSGYLVCSAMGHTHQGLALAQAALGNPVAARMEFARARARYRRLDHHSVLASTYLAELRDIILPYHTTDLVERREAAEAAADALDRASGALQAGISHRWAWLSLYLLEGNWAAIHEIVREAPAPGNYYLRREISTTLAHLAFRQGDSMALRGIVRSYLPDGPATAPGGCVFLDGQVLQRLAVAQSIECGDLTAARMWLEAHDRWLDWSGAVLGQPEGQSSWAGYFRAAGDLDRARAASASAVGLARAPHRPLALLKALRLDGDLALDAHDPVAASSSLQEAHDLAVACAAPYELALTNMVAARLQASFNRQSEAIDLLAEARQTFVRLGAAPALARLDSAVRLIESGGASAAPRGLTSRELDVLRLVSEGLTDATIAERLFISPRTVGQHLRSTYAKLGVSTRSAATRFAVEHRLV